MLPPAGVSVFVRGAGLGALSGLAATILMSVVMISARRAGISGELPPDKIAEAAVEGATGREATEGEEDAVAAVTHLGFGAAAGALFGLMVARMRSVPDAAAAALGAVFASGVWLVSYQGWVPFLHIMRPASEDRPGRTVTMVVAHWVYGMTLGVATLRLRDLLGRD